MRRNEEETVRRNEEDNYEKMRRTTMRRRRYQTPQEVLDRAHRRKMTPRRRRSHMVLGWCTLYQSYTVAYSTDYSKEEGNPRRSLTI